jgi:hypothetical protein
MAVSGTMFVTRATFWQGSSAILTQRGSDTWGANYLYNSDGLQNDILMIADEFENLSVSGAFATDAEVALASGAAVLNASGIAATEIDADVAALSGTLVTSQTFTYPTLVSGSFSSNIRPSTSGDVRIGTSDYPLAASGIIMSNASGAFYIYVKSDGTVSGVFVA